ncbi:hypothetical protein [Nocardioides daejeonensis]|uniref:hypothetical protein n=1 Tax=Nocardioides daejeonensis TaxID=1046556 RepID=UPI000D742B06|nr:hypothetical protein [Nocardioides daejeonensis]
MQDQFDVTLEDGELLLEVEITANLIVAASESDGPLSQEEIDAILGVVPQAPDADDSDDSDEPSPEA